MIVAYITHPLGESDTPTAMGKRHDNMAGAIEWFRFLVMTTRWCISAPWFVYVVAVDEDFGRSRALRDQVEFIHRSDVLVLCGGRISPHMEIWRNHARNRIAHPIPVLDLTDLGDTPPWVDLDKTTLEIKKRAKAIGL